jgi:hypothetical protein
MAGLKTARKQSRPRAFTSSIRTRVGKLFSVSLAGVEFSDKSTATELTYTEQGFFLHGAISGHFVSIR